MAPFTDIPDAEKAVSRNRDSRGPEYARNPLRPLRRNTTESAAPIRAHICPEGRAGA